MTRKLIKLDASSTDLHGLLALSLILSSSELVLDVDIERSERFIVIDSRAEE